jgi:hypothetical protein
MDRQKNLRPEGAEELKAFRAEAEAAPGACEAVLSPIRG